MLQKFTVVHYAYHVTVTIDVDCINRGMVITATNGDHLILRASGADAKRYMRLTHAPYDKQIDAFNDRCAELAREFLRLNPEPYEDPITYLTE